jgi:2-polyprenyl-3-methyl-5-hydroxy-6-metoxy-1,4-benzoquinol methylase
LPREEAELNDQRAEAFQQEMVTLLNQSALNLAVAIGYRTGLFEAMAEIGRPAAIATISEKSGADRRYVREWLAIMTAGGIVELVGKSGEAELYHLPPEHAACLVREAGNRNLAVYSQEIPILTLSAMEAVVEAFQHGDGLPYTAYPGFQAFMSELSNAKHREILVDKFLPTVAEGDLVGELRRGIQVCDIGCGEGVALVLMAEAFPKSRFTGIDASPEAIAKASRLLETRSLPNAEFVIRDAATLMDDGTLEGAFDYVVAFDAIHDQAAPKKVLAGIHRMLSENGLFSMVDIAAESDLASNLDHPMAPFLYTVSLLHCLPVGRYRGGEGLGMMWGRKKAVAYLEQAGFSQVEVIEMPHDAFNYHYLCRK